MNMQCKLEMVKVAKIVSASNVNYSMCSRDAMDSVIHSIFDYGVLERDECFR